MVFNKDLKDKKGQAMVEMAIGIVLIVMLAGIIVSVGQLFLGKITAQMAAYEGARQAVVLADRGSAQVTANKRAKEILNNGVGLDRTKDAFSFSASSWTKGEYLTYTVSAEVRTLFPVIGSDYAMNKQTKVNGKITMMIERNP